MNQSSGILEFKPKVEKCPELSRLTVCPARKIEKNLNNSPHMSSYSPKKSFSRATLHLSLVSTITIFNTAT